MTWPLDHPVVIGGWIMLVGLFFAAFAGYHWRRGVRSRTWPSVVGRVIEARSVEDSDGQWSVEVTFAYSVGGEHFRGEETIHLSWPTHDRAREVLAGYPRGGEIDVWYDPA
jgi:hypothetical protein